MPMAVAKTDCFLDNFHALIKNVDYLSNQIEIFEIYSKFKNKSSKAVARAESVLLKNTNQLIFSHNELLNFAKECIPVNLKIINNLDKMSQKLCEMYADGSVVANIFDKKFSSRLAVLKRSMKKANNILDENCSKEEKSSQVKKLNDLQVKLSDQFEQLKNLDQSTGIGFTEKQVETIFSNKDQLIDTAFKIKNYVSNL